MESVSDLRRPATDPDTVSADINYQGEMEGKPFVNLNDFSKNRLNLENRHVTMRNARLMVPPPTLDKEGFVLVRQPLPKLDYRDQDAINRDYLPLIQDLIKDVTGGDKVVISDGPVTRFSSPLEKDAIRPAGFAHTDYTAQCARDLLRLSYDRSMSPEEGYAETRRLMESSIDVPAGQPREYKRVLAVQSWRVLSDPPHDMPLAICAANSVAAEDIVDAEFGYEASDFAANTLEFSLYHYHQRHAWSWFPDMQKDEVLIFVGYDFNSVARSRVLHTAFRDPNCPADAVGRASVEARSFVFFKD